MAGSPTNIYQEAFGYAGVVEAVWKASQRSDLLKLKCCYSIDGGVDRGSIPSDAWDVYSVMRGLLTLNMSNSML